MKTNIDKVLERLEEELNIEFPLYDGQSVVSQEDLRVVINEVYRLTCKFCNGTGKKVIGEHETLTNEWVSDYAPCDHRG